MSGLDVGLTGLLVSQRALQTIGHNIANANTPGYNRQVNVLSARNPLETPYGIIGQGVTLNEILRMKDDLVHNQILSFKSLLGSSEAQNEILKHVEGIFNELSEYSLGNTIEKFFEGIQELSITPELMSSRYQLLQDGINLANTFKYLDTQLKQLKFDNGEQIDAKVAELNNTTDQVADLNKRITAISLSGGNASDLLDQRDVLVTRLSELADIRVTNNDNGTINVLLGGTLVVHGNNMEQLSTTATGGGTYRIDGIATLNSGELKGLLDIQDVLLVSYMDDLNTLAASIIQQINNIHSEGAGLDGGFTTLTSTNAVNNITDDLTDTGLAFPPTVGTYTTGTIASADNFDGTSTVTGIGTAFTSNVNPTDWIKIGVNFYKILSVVNDNTLTIEGGITAGPGIGTDITDGSLYVTITNDTTGAITKNSISIVAGETLTTLAAKLDGIANLNANIGGEIMSVFTDNGFTYNFTKALDTNPGVVGGSTVSLSGYYDGSDNDIYTLTVQNAGTGDIGTGSAVIRVTDASGTILADLDVGSSYTAGDVLQISDGISVSFSGGAIALADTPLTFDVVSDPDTSNVLAALGLNTFFDGSDAASIEVAQYIQDDVSRIGAASSDSPGDNTNVLRLADVQNNSATEGSSFRDFLSGIVSELGIDVQVKSGEEASFSALVLNLENRRQALSGVSIEEEMVNIIRFQQAFQASAKYVRTLTELDELLMNM